MRPPPPPCHLASAQPGSDSGGFTVRANAPTPFPVLDSEGADAMVVESATSGTPPTPQTQHRRAQAARARETQANLIESWVRAEEDAEAVIRWTERTLQAHEARHAMTASLPLWRWPSDGQASEGNPDGGHGLHETMFAPSTTTDVYWYTNHVSSSASIHWQFYKREINLMGIRLDGGLFTPKSLLANSDGQASSTAAPRLPPTCPPHPPGYCHTNSGNKTTGEATVEPLLSIAPVLALCRAPRLVQDGRMLLHE